MTCRRRWSCERLLARLRGEKIIRLRSYIRRVKAASTLDGQEKWEV